MALVVLIAFTACDQGGSASTETPGGDSVKSTEGFTTQEVPGSQATYLSRIDRAGNILEEGFQMNGQRYGSWVTYHPGSKIPKNMTSYVEGKANGLYLEFNERGQMSMRADYQNNKLHGYWAKYRFGRPTMEANYLNGELHGTVFEYDIGTGAVQKEITYKNGVLDGPYRFYNEEGRVTIEYMYKNGKKISGGAVNSDGLNQPR